MALAAPPTIGRDDGSPARWLLLLTILLILFVVAAIGLSVAFQRPGETHTITIPLGTAARLDAGEDVDLIPANLRYSLSDRLIIINNDSRLHQVGPFAVGPGERVDQKFGEVATFQGICSLHPSGSVTIEIEAG